jgi:hypothetical protein
LILVDPQGEPHWLELKRTLLGSDARKAPLFLPLPVGGTFSFPVDLENYWAGTPNEINYNLKPGTYRLAAHLSGFIETANSVTFRTEGPGFRWGRFTIYCITRGCGLVAFRELAGMARFPIGGWAGAALRHCSDYEVANIGI